MNEGERPSQAIITVHEISQQPVREKHLYAPIVQREFKSTIPAHLLANLPEDERFMVETMSKLENQFNWLSDWAIKNNEATLDLDQRVMSVEAARGHQDKRLAAAEGLEDKVNKLWDWKQFFSGKSAVIAGIVLVVYPIAVKFLFDLVMKWIKP
jgi:hypothetical protein